MLPTRVFLLQFIPRRTYLRELTIASNWTPPPHRVCILHNPRTPHGGRSRCGINPWRRRLCRQRGLTLEDQIGWGIPRCADGGRRTGDEGVPPLRAPAVVDLLRAPRCWVFARVAGAAAAGAPVAGAPAELARCLGKPSSVLRNRCFSRLNVAKVHQVTLPT